jgi:hypothetical protein
MNKRLHGFHVRSFIITALALIVFLAFLLYSLTSQHTSPINPGWKKIEPLLLSIHYKGDTFSGSFVNKLDTSIKVNSVSLNETIMGQTCFADSPDMGSEVKSGGTFILSGINCPHKEDGEAYDMLIIIEYKTTAGVTTTDHKDMGHIRGSAEAY